MSTDRRAHAGTPVRVLGAGLVALASLSLAACGGGSTGSPGDGSTGGGAAAVAASSSPSDVPTAPVLASVGTLRIAAGYVPAPASPDVAAAYLTVTNSGSAADTLVGATSDASRTTTMHRTDGGSMVPLTSLAVPADASVAFAPGADHLMLDGLTRTLVKGDRVVLTLEFATAGTVTVTVPVTGYPTGGGLPSEALSPLPSGTVAP